MHVEKEHELKKLLRELEEDMEDDEDARRPTKMPKRYIEDDSVREKSKPLKVHNSYFHFNI